MDTKLLQDTVAMLSQYIDSETMVHLIMDEHVIKDIMDMLHECELTYSRKMTLLACCILIHVAAARHFKLDVKNNEWLTRCILDGDYLIGLLFRLVIKRKEIKLLAHLLPIQKQLTLQKMRGSEGLVSDLNHAIHHYLEHQRV